MYNSKWCRTRQASINSSIVLIFFSLCNSHLLIFVQGDNNNKLLNNLNITQSTVNPFQYQRCYLHPNYVRFFEHIYTWIDMLLVTLIPFIFIILCNLTVINRVFLVSGRNKENEYVHRSKRVLRLRSLCLIMVCSSIVFVATTLPVTAFIIDLLSRKASIDDMRCRRIQWTIYNILMYFNYASILSYCLSGTEFRHACLRTIHFRTKPTISSMLQTDVVNATNLRRVSTPQQVRRGLAQYEDRKRFHLSTPAILLVSMYDKDKKNRKIPPVETDYLQVQRLNNVDSYQDSSVNQTKIYRSTMLPTLPSSRDTECHSDSYASKNTGGTFDDTNNENLHSQT